MPAKRKKEEVSPTTVGTTRTLRDRKPKVEAAKPAQKRKIVTTKRNAATKKKPSKKEESESDMEIETKTNGKHDSASASEDESPRGRNAKKSKHAPKKEAFTVSEELKKKLTKKELEALEYKWVDWRQLSIIGIEEGAEEETKEEDWSFEDMNKELQTGVLSDRKYPLSLFLGAQPVQFSQDSVINLPYIVILDCSVPPSERVALTSIQLGTAMIKPAKSLKMSWVPYIPKNRDPLRSKIAPKILYLKSEERSTVFEKRSEEYKYQTSLVLPYDLLPQIFDEAPLEQRLKEVINVNLTYTATTGQKIFITYDKSCMNLTTEVEAILEDNNLPKEDDPLIRAALKKAFVDARAAVEAQYDNEKKELNKIGEARRTALRNMKIYKFYPSHPKYNIKPFISKVVNRYYGKADYVFPEPPDMAMTNNINNNNNNSGFSSTTTTTATAAAPSTGFTFVDPLANTATTTNGGGFSFGGSAAASAPATTGGFSFGTIATATTAAPASTGGFTFTDPLASANTSAASDNGTSAAPVGFTFNATTAALTNAAYLNKQSKEPGADEWKCACCENINPNSSKACSDCLTAKP